MPNQTSFICRFQMIKMADDKAYAHKPSGNSFLIKFDTSTVFDK